MFSFVENLLMISAYQKVYMMKTNYDLKKYKVLKTTLLSLDILLPENTLLV
jgi:hypothetical protein